MFKRFKKLNERKKSLVASIVAAGVIMSAVGIGTIGVAVVATMVG